MTLLVNDREYELLLASSGEGMALELWLVGSSVGPIALVFYRDDDDSMTFSAFERDIPFELIEILVSNARKALTPTMKIEDDSDSDDVA